MPFLQISAEYLNRFASNMTKLLMLMTTCTTLIILKDMHANTERYQTVHTCKQTFSHLEKKKNPYVFRFYPEYPSK